MPLSKFLCALGSVLCTVVLKLAATPRVAPRQYGTCEYPQDIH